MEGRVQEAVKYISITNCFSDVLELSQELQYQDVTIICDGGKCHINSFLLASIFPIVKNIPISSLEDMIISLPDVKHKKLTEFFGNIHSQQPSFPVSASIFEFLFNNLKYETISEEDYLSEIIKNDLEGLDPINDDESENSVQMNNDVIADDENENFEVQENSFGRKKCHLCAMSFKQKRYLIRHWRDFHFYCCLCFKSFKDKSLLKKHNVDFHNEIEDPKIRFDEKTNQFYCGLCSHCTTNKSNMRVHYAARHVETAENGYIKCPKCNIKLHSRDLETHSCVLYPCDVCGKEFNSIDGVTQHKKRHADLGTYNCQLCEKPFKSKSSLKMHYITSHGEKIPCHICGKEISSVSYKEHLKTHDEKNICEICNKVVRNIKRHMLRLHTKDEDKPHRCSDCGKGFDSALSLESHRMSVHLKLRPYKCRYGCAFAYNDNSNRNAHEKKTHGSIFQKASERGVKS